ncbi:class I SAM-dependent methyltransferase [Mycobacterium sp. 1465703.0]|uniref:methyltransferase domain-containing protein n=1 Tax=Mycobacterium sp. 1465703.0 TaxID=1834078 RepID=UPI0009F29910|nr:class I SAM-dependent methyltransferase [Mycobacterium sp. 1465703.0]
MKFSDLSSLNFVKLYAGDIPGMPEYRSSKMVGLSLRKKDKWHIRHDVAKPLPIPDESVDNYQSEDVFEHIELERLPATISEIYRVLKKGGLFTPIGSRLPLRLRLLANVHSGRLHQVIGENEFQPEPKLLLRSILRGTLRCHYATDSLELALRMGL